MTSKEVVPVFYTIGKGYVPVLSVAIKSLLENVSLERNYKIHVLYQELTTQEVNQLEGLVEEVANVDLECYKFDQDITVVQDRKENYLRGEFFTPTIFYRLFIAEMFPEYEKGIYLDADTIVNADLAQLYDHDLGTNLIAAVPDFSIRDVPPLQDYLVNAVGVQAKGYINSGVLLINLDLFRKEKFVGFFLNLMKNNYFESIAPDQDYLNNICEGRILYLDEKWNTMSNAKSYGEHKNPAIIHYNLFYKPWHTEDVTYGKYFWEAAKKTAYLGYLQKQLAAYGDEQRKADQEKLMWMAQKGAQIARKDKTFKTFKEAGGQVHL